MTFSLLQRSHSDKSQRSKCELSESQIAPQKRNTHDSLPRFIQIPRSRHLDRHLACAPSTDVFRGRETRSDRHFLFRQRCRILRPKRWRRYSRSRRGDRLLDRLRGLFRGLGRRSFGWPAHWSGSRERSWFTWGSGEHRRYFGHRGKGGRGVRGKQPVDEYGPIMRSAEKLL